MNLSMILQPPEDPFSYQKILIINNYLGSRVIVLSKAARLSTRVKKKLLKSLPKNVKTHKNQNHRA